MTFLSFLEPIIRNQWTFFFFFFFVWISKFICLTLHYPRKNNQVVAEMNCSLMDFTDVLNPANHSET